jgi:uncharacterized protein
MQPKKFNFEFTWSWVSNELERLLPPFLLGSLILGLVLASLAYICMQLFWRWQVSRTWDKRKQSRNKPKDQA